MPNSIFFLLHNKNRSFYRWLHPLMPCHKYQNGAVSQNFIFLQFLPFPPGTPLNQLERYQKYYSKGVLSYTAAISERGEYKQF